MKTLYAHSANINGEWHKLEDHLLNTATLTHNMCKVKRLKDIAYMLGLFHDLGKAYQEFQDRLTHENKNSFNHPGLSVFLITNKFPQMPLTAKLEEIVRGHHRGLDIAVRRDYRLEARLGIPQQVNDFVESLNPYIKQVSKQKISYHDSLHLAGCLFAADWCDTSIHFQTYSKEQKFISIDVGKNIERYLYDIVK